MPGMHGSGLHEIFLSKWVVLKKRRKSLTLEGVAKTPSMYIEGSELEWLLVYQKIYQFIIKTGYSKDSYKSHIYIAKN